MGCSGLDTCCDNTFTSADAISMLFWRSACSARHCRNSSKSERAQALTIATQWQQGAVHSQTCKTCPELRGHPYHLRSKRELIPRPRGFAQQTKKLCTIAYGTLELSPQQALQRGIDCDQHRSAGNPKMSRTRGEAVTVLQKK
eukprot:3410504-Amphidinium_carterae.1